MLLRWHSLIASRPQLFPSALPSTRDLFLCSFEMPKSKDVQVLFVNCFLHINCAPFLTDLKSSSLTAPSDNVKRPYIVSVDSFSFLSVFSLRLTDSHLSHVKCHSKSYGLLWRPGMAFAYILSGNPTLTRRHSAKPNAGLPGGPNVKNIKLAHTRSKAKYLSIKGLVHQM